MTRLYYQDSRRLSFDATVVACDSVGDTAHVRLNETAFYPTSGGQPHDTGTLGGVAVVDVIDDEATGEVIHVTNAPLAVGAVVHGEIDPARRLDHMQQHTGQHILSAVFDRLFGVRTMSFHMGATSSTIDLSREVTPAEIDRAVADANHVVWDDRVITIRYASDAEAAALPLRKESQRSGTLRLIEVPDCDLSACGGTHVPSTGVIGMIVVSGVERFKGGSRVSFLCGGRALSGYNVLRDVTMATSRSLSIGVAELPDAVDRMAGEIKDQKRQIRQLQEQVAAQLAQELRASAVSGRHGARIVIADRPGWDAAALKFLASSVVSVPGFVVVLTGEGSPVPVVVARSEDVALDSGLWIKEAIAALGGRGGGRPELAQGGLTAGAQDVLARATETLS